MIGVKMSNIRFQLKSGNVSAALGGDALNMVNELLNKVAPKSKRALVEYVQHIEDFARSKWLVRKKNSQRSIDKFYTRFFITPNLEIMAVVGNSARYSYAIKVGPESEESSGTNSLIPTGRRLSQETMIKPSRKNIDKLVDILADEIARGLM